MVNQKKKSISSVGSASIFSQSNAVLDQDAWEIERRTFSGSLAAQFRALEIGDASTQPLRPNYGNKGASTTLFANYFALAGKASVQLHRYSVTPVPKPGESAPRGPKLAELIKLLLRLVKLKNKDVCLATDYATTLVANRKLSLESGMFEVNYLPESASVVPTAPAFVKPSGSKAPVTTLGKPKSTSVNARVYNFEVRYENELNVDELLAYLESHNIKAPPFSAKEDVLQALNVVIGHGLKGAKAVAAHNNKFVQLDNVGDEKANLGSGIEMFRGYSYSIRPATGRLLLNTQVRYAAMYQPQNLDALLQQLGINRGCPEYNLAEAERRIKGAKVKITAFQPTRYSTVHGFANSSAGRTLQNPARIPRYGATASEIQVWTDGKYSPFAVAVRKLYQGPIGSYPVINVGSQQAPMYVIAEMCEIQPGTLCSATLDSQQSAKMIKTAVRTPVENASSIVGKGFQLVNAYSLANLNNFGWTVSNNLVKVPGRVLPAPEVLYNDKSASKVYNASWDLSSRRFVEAGSMRALLVVYIMIKGARNILADPSKDLHPLVRELGSTLFAAGITKGDPPVYEFVELDSEPDCQTQINGAIGKWAQIWPGKEPLLVLVVLPKVSTPIYNAVKQAGDVTYGVHTICILAEKLQAQMTATMRNVALKFNLKLGGKNHALAGSDLDFIAEGKTMVVGLDVTHPASGEDKAPSIACIVASVDHTCAQFPAYASIQTARQEVVDVLKDMMKNRLDHWRTKNNGSLPEQLLIYRDGVSEGQYQIIRDIELRAIKDACEVTYDATQTKKGLPRITIVIVGKRHNTRFYPTSEQASWRGNPKNGTVVDRGITESRVWDFYLQSHTAIQGTARPGHYVVIHDEIFRARFKAEAANVLEKITHNLCYMFGRATKAVRVCTPAYYADIACDRARRWLSRLYGEYGQRDRDDHEAQSVEVRVHPKLENTMFYI